MLRVSEHRARPRIGRALATVATAVLCAVALGQPNLAYAGPHGGGGGGFHGGGFGGFHGGGFHSGGFAGFHGDRFHDGRFDHDRFRNRGFFFGRAFAYPGWVIIRIMDTMITANPTPLRLGTIAPILPAITHM